MEIFTICWYHIGHACKVHDTMCLKALPIYQTCLGVDMAHAHKSPLRQASNIWHVSVIGDYSFAKEYGACILAKYVCDKSKNARVCAKWQWNALDWCYWIALAASPVVQSSNTLSCVSLSFHTHPCVLAICPFIKLVWESILPMHINHPWGKQATSGMSLSLVIIH